MKAICIQVYLLRKKDKNVLVYANLIDIIIPSGNKEEHFGDKHCTLSVYPSPAERNPQAYYLGSRIKTHDPLNFRADILTTKTLSVPNDKMLVQIMGSNPTEV